MSTSATHIDLSSSWKQEVNRRVAAHMHRKAPSAAELQTAQESRPSSGDRAAQAAARVAARYAKAPSYSEMLANEARAAMFAAEAASQAAHEAKAAAQSVLDSLEAAQAAESASESNGRAASLHVFREESAGEAEAGPQFTGGQADFAAVEARWSQTARSVEPARDPSGEPPFAVRWEPELPLRQPEPLAVRARHAAGLFDAGVQDWPEPGSPLPYTEEFEMVEPAEPIHGNLIEFPRELVATRRVRPRLVEGPLAAGEQGSQLSIFEVDPGAISIDPEPPLETGESAVAFTGPEWSGIRLDAQPEEQLLPEEPPQVQQAPAIELASASRHLLAVVVDLALIAGIVLTIAFVVLSKSTELPELHAIEIGSVLALAMAGALYQALFLTWGKATPGMKYAQLRLCSFEGRIPTRAQRSARLVALLLSVLPVGVGIAWAIFDEDHLTWHDRLSGTYLRRY